MAVMMMEMNALEGIGSPPDGMLIFYDSPPNLEQLAMMKTAAKLLSIKMAEMNWENENEREMVQIKRYIEKLIISIGNTQLLTFPVELEERILRQMILISGHMIFWLFFHWNLIDNLKTLLSAGLLLDFVWRWDHGVNYVLTAKNLIYGGKLSDREKFKMACAYCLKFELQHMYESFDWVRNWRYDQEFRYDVRFFYWHSRISGSEPMIADERGISYEKYLLDNNLMTFNLMALDYYFERLAVGNPEERLDFCLNRMLELHSSKLRFLIMKMTVEEQKILFKLKGQFIMERFITEAYPHFALQFWNHVKDTISGDKFVQMMRTSILKIDGKSHEDYSDDESKCYVPSWWQDFATDVWKSTPRHLKQFAFQYQNGSFIFEWDQWFKTFAPSSYHRRFLQTDAVLLLILDDADSKFKRRFWLQEWARLMVNSRPGFLRRLMFACMSDLHEIREFERKILTSDAMIEYLMSFFRKFDVTMIVQLNEFFDVLGSDLNLRSQTKTRLTDQLTEIPEVFDREPSSLADDRELLHSLAEFFRDVNQNSKMNFICRLFDILSTKKYSRSLNPSFVFDNILMVAGSLCDAEHMQIILREAPSRNECIEDFVSKGSLGVVESSTE